MAEDLNKKVDELEAAAKKYASKDTVISIGGYEFTPAKLMVAATIVSSTLGGLYGTFEVYKDYMGMKKKIAEYVSPDLSEFDKRLAVIEQNSAKTSDYTRDIKNDLKNDLRRNETVTEQIERSVKQSQREIEQDVKTVQREMRADQDRTRSELEKLRKEVDSKIQKAIDNPLANK
jgi:ATP-dependent Lon protease